MHPVGSEPVFGGELLIRITDHHQGQGHHWFGELAQLLELRNPVVEGVDSRPDRSQPLVVGRQQEILHGGGTVLDPVAGMLLERQIDRRPECPEALERPWLRAG